MEIRTGTAKSGDLDIYYEDMGDQNHPPVLLIMGLGAQLLLWRKGFCEKLVNQGLRVIRYDNRDVGLSSKVTGRHSGAKLLPRMVRSFLGKPSPAVYTLEDLGDHAAHRPADDVGVVDAQMVQQRRGVVGEIFERVHRRTAPSEERPDHSRQQLRAGVTAGHLAGQADVAVVVADHTQTLVDELLAETLAPQH